MSNNCKCCTCLSPLFPKEAYEEIKNHILAIKTNRLNEMIEDWEAVNNIGQETYEKWAKEHMRTPYKRLPGE